MCLCRSQIAGILGKSQGGINSLSVQRKRVSNRVSGSQALLSRKQNFHCLYSLISKVLIPTEVSQIEALHLQIYVNGKSTSQVAGVTSAQPELPLNGAERKIMFKTQAPSTKDTTAPLFLFLPDTRLTGDISVVS